MFQVIINGCDQLVHRAESSATDAFFGQVSEHPFHHIQPRRGSRNEMHMEAGMFFQPEFNFGMLVGLVVVQNQMQIQALRSLPVYLPQE